MNKVYHHYSRWEDYQNGMYKKDETERDKELLQKAIGLLSNPSKLYDVMRGVSMIRVMSSEQNLSNKDINRRAWLGRAACCFECGVPEWLTRIAWYKLSKHQQDEANRIADKVIREWEEKYSEVKYAKITSW